MSPRKKSLSGGVLDTLAMVDFARLTRPRRAFGLWQAPASARALAIELSLTGIANSRIRALPTCICMLCRVHTRRWPLGFWGRWALKKRVRGAGRSNSQFKHSLNCVICYIPQERDGKASHSARFGCAWQCGRRRGGCGHTGGALSGHNSRDTDFSVLSPVPTASRRRRRPRPRPCATRHRHRCHRSCAWRPPCPCR